MGFGRRKSSFLGRLAKSCQSKATNSATCAMYTLMWGEEPPKGKKKTGGKKKSGM